MNISEGFLTRPIFAAVVSLIITLLGVATYVKLPTAQYPEITPPRIQVTAVYPGANAKAVAESVSVPLEQQLNGVEGMSYISSTCADGNLTLSVVFETGVDSDMALVRVQNKVAVATSKVPEAVRSLGITTVKKSPDILMVISVMRGKTPSDTDESSRLTLSNYTSINIKDPLARVPGVGSINAYGSLDYGMRIWLDPEKMAARGISASDVIAAIKQQNQQVSAGVIGQEPAPVGQKIQLTIQTKGLLGEEEDFKNIIIRRGSAGDLLYLKDVARIELGGVDYTVRSLYNGEIVQNLAIYQLPGSNAIEVAKAVQSKLAELSKSFPKEISYTVTLDTTSYIEECVATVKHTFLEAIFLVLIVVLLFLQSWRATLIPIIAIPVSIIGTFAVMGACGFTINNLTLFGLVLAIGIVVDDAIVVVENVERLMEEGKTAFEATREAMIQISGALIAIALVLCAVFLPVAMISGISGAFYKQFALTIAASTVLSAIVSLTLSPALAVLLLRPKHEKPDAITKVLNFCFGWLFNGFEFCFKACQSMSTKIVKILATQKILTIIIYLGLLLTTGFFASRTPIGFIPDQDQGWFLVNLQLPDGASLQRTSALSAEISKMIREEPAVKGVVEIPGLSFVDNAQLSNAGALFVSLKPHEERHEASQKAQAILARLQIKLNKIQSGLAVAFNAPPVSGLSSTAGLKIMLLDKTGMSFQNLQDSTAEYMQAMGGTGMISSAFSGFRASSPQLFLDIDREHVRRLSVDINSLFQTLQVYLGGVYVNDFSAFGRLWQVRAQADAGFRDEHEKVMLLRIANSKGEMVPLSSVLQSKQTSGAPVVLRYNLFPATAVSTIPKPEVSSGTLITEMEKMTDVLPEGMGYEWTELGLEQSKVESPMKILALGILVVFLVLAAKYESWSLPVAILLVVPLCLLGSTIALSMRGFPNDIFAQIGIVILIGLAAKNSILVVEFAKELRAKGLSIVEAAVEASHLRLRPILMTSFAFIAGVFPLAIKSGAGAEMRHQLSTAVVGGMLGVTLIGVLLTPALYVIVQSTAEFFSKKKEAVEEEIPENHNV